MSSSLTPREFQVAWLFASGLLAKHVAARLGIKRSTVHRYMVSVHQKLKVHNRDQLIALFESEGAL